MNGPQAAAALQHGFDPYAAHPDTGSLFGSIAHAVSSAAKGISHFGNSLGHAVQSKKGMQELQKDTFKAYGTVYNKAVKPVVKKALPIVQTALKNMGPIGMVASGAIGAMQAGLSGKKLSEIAWAAAEGAAPSGIDKALGAAHAIANGSNILKTAIGAAATGFAPATPEALGFDTAIKVLKTEGSKVAMGVARRALPTEGARRAFDAAVGTVAAVVKQNPQALLKRAGSMPDIVVQRARGVLSVQQPNLQHAINTLRRNPTLAAQHPLVLAGRLGTTQQTVMQAVKHISGERLLPWRSLTPRAAKFIKKWHPNAPTTALTHGTSNTAGLDEAGTHYIVTKGDSPWAIAQKLSGNGNNWKLLIPLNKDKKPGVDKTVWVGEVLNIPAAWQKPQTVQAQTPAPVAVSSQPAPALSRPAVKTPKIFFTRSVAPSILQAKSILVAWAKTDGINQAGFSDYGQTAADLSTDFGARDSFVLTSFQNWDNKTQGTKLLVDGILGPDSLTALQQWAERKAKAVTPLSPIAVSQTTPTINVPEMVISATPPKFVPALPGAVSSPAIPAVANAPTPVVTNPVTPPVATPDKPATAATVAAANPGGSKLAPALAGAAIGGVTFGVPGAIIGAVAGAAMA